MKDGNELWKDRCPGGMEQKTLGEETIETFPGLMDNLYQALRQTADKFPQRPAITDNYGKTSSYAQLLEQTDLLAEFLRKEKQIGEGTHVGLILYNSAEFCTAFLALQKLGAVAVPLPGKFRKSEVLPLASRAEAEYIICDEAYADWFFETYSRERLVTVTDAEKGWGYREEYRAAGFDEETGGRDAYPGGGWEKPAIIMFTSGTTSRSKGVLLKNYNIMHAVEVYRRTLGITEKDVSVIATPIYHITGLVALLGLFVYTGGHLYLHKFFDGARIVEEARRHGFTFIHASPTAFNLIIQAGEGTPPIESLRSFACGSSNMPKDKLRRLHQWLPKSSFHTVYGLTETTSPGTVFPEDAASSPYIGSSGLPVPGTRFKITDENGKELEDGQVGEICISGTLVPDGYYKQTSDTLRDGWLRTGDLGYFNRDGYLFVVDRIKNMINRGGEKIWCFDVENELEMMDGIRDAAVTGIPDELYGEVAAAVVCLEPGSGLNQESIQQYLGERIARYKVPVKIKIVDKVPQTPNGKTDKIAIRKMLMEE